MPSYSGLNFAAKAPMYNRDDPRTETIIAEEMVDCEKLDADVDLCLLGFPHHEGCVRNGGRPGAAASPDAVRQFMKKAGTVWNPELQLDFEVSPGCFFKMVDAGDVRSAEDGSTLEEAHAELERKVRQVLQQKKHLIVLGGGDDQSYCNAMGFMHMCETEAGTASGEQIQPVVINIDAHLDCRKLNDQGHVHSGTPFRRLQESETWSQWKKGPAPQFTVFACQGQCCAKSHVEYIKSKNYSSPQFDLVWLREIRLTPPGWFFQQERLRRRENESDCTAASKRRKCGNGESQKQQVVLQTQAGIRFHELLNARGDTESSQHQRRFYISFDVDSISSAYCPAVSAPSVVGGLTAEEAMEIALVSGLDTRVCLLGLAELSPDVCRDPDNRSARLVANMAYYHALGVANRGKAVALGSGCSLEH